jgi:hypothetical protein
LYENSTSNELKIAFTILNGLLKLIAMPLGGLAMTESEIWCSADSMIKTHGTKAALEAAMMADKMLARRNTAGHAQWKRITGAIRELEGHENKWRR